MARKKNHPTSTPEQQPLPVLLTKQPWYKRVRVVVSAISGFCLLLIMNGPVLLQNIRAIPAELETTRNQLVRWMNEDAEWSGDWSNYPEYIVNMGEMHLTDDIDLKISLQAKNGQLGGMIASGKVCSSLPVFDFLLLHGSISGNVATVEVWDIIGGHKRIFERLKIVRDQDVLTIQPERGAESWFPVDARIGKHPHSDDNFMSGYCNRSNQIKNSHDGSQNF
jgi:hypothetical protein